MTQIGGEREKDKDHMRELKKEMQKHTKIERREKERERGYVLRI